MAGHPRRVGRSVIGLSGEAHQCAMHSDKGECTALTIDEQSVAQAINVLGQCEFARCELEECRSGGLAIGNIVQIVVGDIRTQGLRNRLDRIAEGGKVDGTAHDRQEIREPGDDGGEWLSEIGVLGSQLVELRFLVG